MRTASTVILLAAGVGLVCPALSRAGDAGVLPDTDLMQRRYVDAEPIRRTPELKWKTKAVRGAASEEWVHMLVHKGVMYGSANHVLHAIDADSGKLLWTLPGPAGHPAIRDDVLYATGESDFYAVDLKTHKLKWQVKANAMQDGWRQTNGFMKPATVLHEALAHFGGKGGSSNDCSFWAVDAATGKVAWKKKHRNEPALTNLTIGGGRLYSAVFADPNPQRGTSPHGRGTTNSALLAMDPRSGEVLWSRPEMATHCKPVYQDEVLYAQFGERLEAMDARTGRKLWEMALSPGLGLAISGDYLIAGGAKPPLHCVNVKTRQQVWSFKEAGIKEILSPLIVRDVVYVPTCSTVGGDDFKTGRTSPIYGLDLKTGKKLWQCQVPGTECLDEGGNRTAWNSYICGWAYPEGKRLYVFSFTGKFYCFEEK